MTVRHAEKEAQVVLPAEYVARYVELGYVATAYSTQGRTVDTAHTLVGITMTREVLYESATRGRLSNRLYVDVQPEPAGADMTHGPAEYLDVRDVLLTVAARRGSELSAHQTMASEWARATSFEQLAQEHQTLVADANAERWDRVMDRAGLSPALVARARQSPAWTGLLGALRDADSRGLDVEAALPHLAAGRPILPEDDPAIVLQARLRRWETASGRRWQARQEMIAGLVPQATDIPDPDLAQAIREREGAIVERARRLAEEAVRSGAPWTLAFGSPPVDPSVVRPGGTGWRSSPPSETAGTSPPRRRSGRRRTFAQPSRRPTAREPSEPAWKCSDSPAKQPRPPRPSPSGRCRTSTEESPYEPTDAPPPALGAPDR